MLEWLYHKNYIIATTTVVKVLVDTTIVFTKIILSRLMPISIFIAIIWIALEIVVIL